MSIYKYASTATHLKRENKTALIGAAILYASRQCKVPRTFTEVMALCNLPKRDIGRTFKKLEKLMLKQDPTKVSGYQVTEATKTKDLIIRYCDALKLPYKVVRCAEKLAERTEEYGTLGGRSPVTQTATVMYTICNIANEARTQSQIAKATGIGES
jgi:transcription initiation factor TFIIB